MKLRIAAAAATLGLVMAAAPPTVEASHRHSRSCRHGHSSHYRSRDYGRSARDYRYRYVVPARPYYYDQGYAPYRDYSYYDSPRYGYDSGYSRYSRHSRYSRSRGHYHGRSFCFRPHIRLHIDF